MCNFIPVRNFLITLGILAGFAGSSAIFALMWERFGGYPPVAVISYTAAATWAISAVLVSTFALNALTTFCTCAAAIPACASACGFLTALVRLLSVCLVSLFALCAVLAGDILELGWPLRLAVTAFAAAVVVLTAFVAIWASRLGACQGP
jgi:hypothetical protein